MSPRPKSDKSKHNRFELRLDDEMNELLEECSERLQTTKTEVINKGIRLVKSELDKKWEVPSLRKSEPPKNLTALDLVNLVYHFLCGISIGKGD